MCQDFAQFSSFAYSLGAACGLVEFACTRRPTWCVTVSQPRVNAKGGEESIATACLNPMILAESLIEVLKEPPFNY